MTNAFMPEKKQDKNFKKHSIKYKSLIKGNPTDYLHSDSKSMSCFLAFKPIAKPPAPD